MPKGTDGWKRLKERIVRAEQTGGERGDSSEEGGNGGQREEGERVNREERNSTGGIEDSSEVGLLTLAVSQAICVTMLHVLLKG